MVFPLGCLLSFRQCTRAMLGLTVRALIPPKSEAVFQNVSGAIGLRLNAPKTPLDVMCVSSPERQRERSVDDCYIETAILDYPDDDFAQKRRTGRPAGRSAPERLL